MKKKLGFVLTGLFLLAGCSNAIKTPLDVHQSGMPGFLGNGAGNWTFLDDNGDMYTWGFDRYNASSGSDSGDSLGQGTEVLYNNIPTKICSDVAFIYYENRAVTKDGKLIEWGKLWEGDSCLPHPVRENIAKLDYNIYLTRDGKVYSIPNRENIQLTKPYEESGELIMTGVKDIVLGVPCYALKNDGSVWTFLRDNMTGEVVQKPEKVAEDVRKIYISPMVEGVKLFLKNDKTLWSFGNNEFGQCGNGENGDLDVTMQDCVVSEPYQMAENVKEVWPLETTTFYLTEDNKLYACGRNDYDQLLIGGNGQMNLEDYPKFTATPVLVMEDVSQMQYGWGAMQVLKTDGTLWTWGCADLGTLGNGLCYQGDDLRTNSYFTRSEKEPMFSQPTQIMDNVKRLCTGTMKLYFAQKTDGTIWYWGYGAIYVDKEDDWDEEEMWKNADGELKSAYQKCYIIPTPIEFSMDTFFQNALDSIAAREGIDTAQYQAVRYSEG